MTPSFKSAAKPVLHKSAFGLGSKSVLAASVALLSGVALAEQAGRVSFVAGNVSVTSADGQARALKRGDLINGGDRINTGAGRLQLRFTDGGFVSLQPNTVFAVDQYLYANKAPEETSLFFNLVRGGMRTITGAIGKVSKQNYKVRTPVATIGIRGTEYVATVGDDGLVVSVGSGFVNVVNPQGDITGGVGQTIAVAPGGVPVFTDTRAEARARGANDPEGELAQTESEDNASDTTVVLGDILDAEGNPLLIDVGLSQASLPTTELPVYTLISCASACGGPYTVGAVFNAPGAEFDGNLPAGALISAGTTVEGYTSVVTNINYDANSLVGAFQFNDVHTLGSLSWGEFTNGEGMADAYAHGPQELTSTEFVPYIIGVTALKNLGTGTARYSLVNNTATAARGLVSGAVGTLDHFNIDVNFDFSTIAVSLATTIAGETYTATTPNALPAGVSSLNSNQGFSLSGSSLSVVSTGSGCFSNSCTASINGFFAGASGLQLGASYKIGTSADVILGVAALTATTVSTRPAVLAPSGLGYTMASVGTVVGMSGGYQDFGTNSSLSNVFDANGGLTSAYNSATATTELAKGTAAALDVARNGNLNWGRWVGGTATELGSPLVLITNQSLHYITGPMTGNNLFSAPNMQGATARYSYAGGTTATGSDGRTGNLSGHIDVLFGFAPSLSVDLDLSMSAGASYAITGTGLSVSTNAQFMDSTASGLACAPVCTATISGFFAGQQAQQIGLSYQVVDTLSLSTVNGAAAFNTPGITTIATSPNAGGGS